MLTRRELLGWGVAGTAGLLLAACSEPAQTDSSAHDTEAPTDTTTTDAPAGGAAYTHDPADVDPSLGTFERGTQADRGFEVDDLLGDTPAGDVHFSLHVPDAYDGSRPYALYVHCPGWEGLWFQGMGANLDEDYPFAANDYVPDMIVASPQLDDWGDTSARKAVALTRWLLAAYNVDPSRVYLSGYSGGGETISLVMDQAPELYRRALHLSSQWDGSGTALVAHEVPLRLTVGESDDYYGSGPATRAYQDLRAQYEAAGLPDGQIGDLLVLDVKPASYFQGYGSQHAAGATLFAHDPDVMGWLFS